jgi:hypothetical protein
MLVLLNESMQEPKEIRKSKGKKKPGRVIHCI